MEREFGETEDRVRYADHRQSTAEFLCIVAEIGVVRGPGERVDEEHDQHVADLAVFENAVDALLAPGLVRRGYYPHGAGRYGKHQTDYEGGDVAYDHDREHGLDVAFEQESGHI